MAVQAAAAFQHAQSLAEEVVDLKKLLAAERTSAAARKQTLEEKAERLEGER